MLTTIPVVTVILLIALLGYAATRPDTFRVERAARIQAAPEEIFSLIIDFKQWADWSPYEKLDPAMKKTYSGAASGKGAVYEWAGNAKAGQGRMEITDTLQPSRIVIKLDFIRPFEGHNYAEFTLESGGSSTTVIWALYGPQPYLAKLLTLFFNRDRLVGKDFEKGLANLQAVIETKPRREVCN